MPALGGLVVSWRYSNRTRRGRREQREGSFSRGVSMLFEVPNKYPFHRPAHAAAIGNGGPIKTGESATGKRADNQRTHYPCNPRILLAQICDDERSATPMIEYDLVKKEADPLNMNLIDFVCPR